MEVQQVLHMNGGEGETSYALNSSLQRTVIRMAKPIVEKAIIDLCYSTFSECLSIADLGCSSGPNTLLVISDILDTANIVCQRLNRHTPGFQVFLNDLPGNDFNTIFKSLPTFYENLKKQKGDSFGPCFISGMPGSFYERLFPNKALHLVHSSYSLHFLSQVPQELKSANGSALNKGNIYLAKTSPPSVCKAYKDQFESDFSLFLRLRSEEITPGGRAVLTFMGRRTDDPTCDENCTPWTMLALALNDLLSEGLIDEEKLDSFNLPYYAASAKEVRELIEKEGSFNLNALDMFEVSWDANYSVTNCSNHEEYLTTDNLSRAKKVRSCIRSVAEAMVANHFGKTVVAAVFDRFTERVSQLYAREEPKYANLVISVTKK